MRRARVIPWVVLATGICVLCPADDALGINIAPKCTKGCHVLTDGEPWDSGAGTFVYNPDQAYVMYAPTVGGSVHTIPEKMVVKWSCNAALVCGAAPLPPEVLKTPTNTVFVGNVPQNDCSGPEE
jgi:hypothetical protein